MTEPAACTAAVALSVLGAGLGYRLLRRCRAGAGTGTRYVAALTLCLTLSLLLLSRAAPGAVPPRLAHLVPLLGGELRLAAECFLALLAHAVRPTGRPRPWARRQGAFSLAVMAACAVAYLAAGVGVEDGKLLAADGGRAELAVYSALFTGHSLLCTALFTVLVHRAARLVGPGPLRTGLRLVAAGGAASVVWSAFGVFPLLDVVADGRRDIADAPWAVPFALLSGALGIGGASLTAWAARPPRRRGARRSHRRIRPLWSALCTAHPRIALDARPPGGRFSLPLRTGEFALYRRVIEVHDGRMALRGHVHPLAPLWAAEACAGLLPPARRAATEEAAVIAAALEAAAAGLRFPGSADPGPPAGHDDLDAEIGWLVEVAEAFAHSEAVARVRRRMRAELAAATAAAGLAAPPAPVTAVAAAAPGTAPGPGSTAEPGTAGGAAGRPAGGASVPTATPGRSRRTPP
ncbi:MAB_1171c family putative transporter [Streptomyces sp. NPDC002073]